MYGVSEWAGRRAFILLSTAREWKSVKNTGARCMLHIRHTPPGGVPWGDAVGWPDAAGAVESDGKAKLTHSWGLDGGGVGADQRWRRVSRRRGWGWRVMLASATASRCTAYSLAK